MKKSQRKMSVEDGDNIIVLLDADTHAKGV